ncbi:MAG: hypothetical protein GX226_01635 [Dehalococcoidales bacterium]|jgi:hypothetical protein|nr:hypothetical protein [Dehalococcoidales bacterium]
MEKQHIRSIGNLYFDNNLINGPGAIIAKDFCRQLTIETCKQAGSYIRAINDNPFAYRERQLVSLLAPAMSRFTDAFLTESPVKRNWSKLPKRFLDDSHGWVDYWCLYRNISFLLELKHGYINAGSGKLREKTLIDWDIAVDQLDVIREAAKDEAYYNRGALLIALQILPIYKGGQSIVQVDDEKLTELHPACINQMKSRSNRNCPNYSVLWQLHPDLVIEQEYTNSKEIYPGVLFLFYISELF